MWQPQLAPNGRTPRYQAIADAIARDVNAGLLQAGQQLPTHRSLATHLGVTVGTVTRGYAEAERRGLTVGEVGRGTFVRSPRTVDAFDRPALAADGCETVVDLSLALPWISPCGEDGRELAAALQALAQEPLDELLAYQPDTALPRHLEAAAEWVARLGVRVPPDRLLVTGGAQHGLLVILSSLLAPGETVLTASLTYPGIKSVAGMLGLRLRGVAQDAEGIIPEALEEAFEETGARAVYCMPSNQNPTTATMSEERRLAVAEAAWAYDALIVEDAVSAPLVADGLPALATLAPERTVFVSSFSKAVAFGLRVGVLAAPAAHVARLRAGVRASSWMTPPLMMEVAARWIHDGTAERMIQTKRDELATRQELVGRILGPVARVHGHPRSMHAWMLLPERWRSEDFVTAARQRGVYVAGAEAFAVGRHHIPHAVRICVGRVAHRARLEEALETLAGVASGSREACCGGIL